MSEGRRRVILDGSSLTLPDLWLILTDQEEVEVVLDEDCVRRVSEATEALESLIREVGGINKRGMRHVLLLYCTLSQGKTVYGSTTQVSLRKGKGHPENVDEFSRDLTAGYATRCGTTNRTYIPTGMLRS